MGEGGREGGREEGRGREIERTIPTRSAMLQVSTLHLTSKLGNGSWE